MNPSTQQPGTKIMTQSNFMKKLMAARCKLTSYKGDGRTGEHPMDADDAEDSIGMRLQSQKYDNKVRYGESFEGVKKVYHAEMRRCKFNTIHLMKDEELQKEFDDTFVDGATIYMVKIIIRQKGYIFGCNTLANEWSIEPVKANYAFDNQINFAEFYVAHHATKKIFDGYSGSSSQKNRPFMNEEMSNLFDYHYAYGDEYEDVIFFFDTLEESYNCERRLIQALSKTIPKEFQKGEYYRNTGNLACKETWAGSEFLGPIRLANIANGGQGRRPQIQIHENQVYHTDRENWRWEKVDRSMSVPGHRDQIDILKESARYLNIAPKYMKRLQDIY
jgi:hypothetical protein